MYKISENQELYVSAVTIYKLYMGATNAQKAKDVEELTNGFSILPFSDNVAKKAAEIYHKLRLSNQMIEFRNIFIAATCIVNELPIVTPQQETF